MSVLPYDCNERSMETLVEGMRALLRKNLASQVALTAQATAGSQVIQVANTLRFNPREQVALLAESARLNERTGHYEGVEYHTIEAIIDSHTVKLATPLGQTFAANSYMQKALRNTFIYPKDIYMGDRETATWDYVAICVEPMSLGGEWLAINGTLADEWKMDILIYVKLASMGEQTPTGDPVPPEETALRTAMTYADTIRRLMANNLHLDLAVDDVALARDAYPGDDFVWIAADQAVEWPPDATLDYEIQDNYKSEWCYALTELESESSTSSVSYSSAYDISSLSSETSSTALSSSTSSLSQSSTSLWSSSSSSWHRSSSSSTSSLHSGSSGSASSSTHGTELVKIYLNTTIGYHYRVADHAVLRRCRRYMYNSFPSEVQYAMVQKGEYLLKAARISWFGKETQQVPVVQVGRGGKAY